MQHVIILLGFVILFTGWTDAQTIYPQVALKNSDLQVLVYLPNAKAGFYRGTRFDWSGVIGSLLYQGHQYFDPWLDYHDPTVHESITGPVEGFAPIGFEEAKPSEHFLTIGVGVLRKPDENPYRFATTYDIINGGKWRSRKKKDRVDFTHTLSAADGYAYKYSKTVRLEKGQPKLILEHQLKNTGKKIIETTVFNHNFFVIDQEPTGPNIKTKFPYPIQAEGRGFGEKIVAQDSALIFLGYLAKGESVYSGDVQGYGQSSKDYHIEIENTKTGAGVLITSDQPVLKLPYWACATTACPEPYIQIKVEPGDTFSWMTEYEFYTME